MILTHDKILEEIDKGNIKIEPFEVSRVGAGSIDLCLGNVFRRFKHHNKVFPVKENSDFEEITELVKIQKGEFLLLKPQETVLGITCERITLAPDLCGWLEGRSRFARLGLGVHITSGFMQPGIDNYQVLEITNLGPTPLGLYPGTAICQMIFQRCEGEARYQGKFAAQKEP